MDIKPFLDFLPTIIEKRFDFLLKLHTKKDNPETGAVWRNIMLESLLGNTELIDNIIDTFLSSPKIALIGPELLYKSAKRFMYSNASSLDKILNIVGSNLDEQNDWGFFTGSYVLVQGGSV